MRIKRLGGERDLRFTIARSRVRRYGWSQRKIGGVFGLLAAVLMVIAFTAWQVLPAQAAPLGNLTAYWKFDESTAGSTAIDSSGNGNDLTPTNNPVPSTDIPSAMNNFFPDSHSAGFDGTNYLSVPDNSTLDDTGAVSISAWVKFNNTSGNQTIAAKWQVSAHQQWVLQLNGGHISWWTGDGGTGSSNELASSTPITTGTWYYVAATATNGSKQLYINNRLDASNSAGSMGVASGVPLTVGSKMTSAGTYFEYLNGNIDDLRVYNRVLSSSDSGDLAFGNEMHASWTGATSTDYATGSNWNTGVVPDAFTHVYIPQSTHHPVLSQDTGAADVNLTGGILDLNGHNMVTHDENSIINNGTVISQNSESATTPIIGGTVMYNNTVDKTGLVLGNSYNNLIFNDGLLGYWKFDEGSGTTAADASGYGLSGSLSGATYASPAPSTRFVNSNSLSFNGTDNYVAVDSDVPAAAQGAAPKTIGMWVYPTQLSEGFAFLGPDGGGNQGQSWRFMTDGSGNLKLDISSGVESSTLKISLNTWQYVAAKWDGSAWQVCLNTNCQTLSSLPASNLQPGMFDIGRGTWDSQYMKGNIDDVRLYNSGLSQAEIDNLAAGNGPSISQATTTLDADLNVQGNLTLDVGTLAAGSHSINLYSNFDNSGGVFSAGTGIFKLTGFNQSISGSNTFYDLKKTPIINDTLTLPASQTQTVEHNLTLTDTSGRQLALQSSKAGTQWKIDTSGASVTLTNLSVQDSDNVGSSTLIATGSTTGGNNTNWNVQPPAISNLGPTALVDGSWTADNTPTVNFTLSDPDSTSLNYTIDFYKNYDFMSTLEYTSDAVPPGAQAFTVGQAGGHYNTSGNANTALPDGTYMWTVQATDSDGLSSDSVGYDTSFNVDTTAPSAPGMPAASTGSADDTPSWSWAASNDSGSGLADPAYTVEWSNASDFSSGVSTDTTNTATYTNDTLADGTWYFRAKATDAVGNTSGWSSVSDPLTIDGTTPTAPGQPLAAQHVTSDTTPDISWTPAKDKGSGLANPAYTLEWSLDPTFTTGTGSLTTNSTSVTIPTSLSTDGKWWLLLTVTDNAGNTSTSGNSVIIDTTAPAKPAASPSGGTYAGAQTINLTSSDNLTTPHIYYTTDGSAPTTSSTVYHDASTPVLITSSETLRAVAYDSVGNVSPVMSETYVITPATPRTPGKPTATKTSINSAKTSTSPSMAQALPTGSSTDKTPAQTTPPTVHFENDTDVKNNNSKNTGAFMGLDWRWLLIIAAVIFFLWAFTASRRKRSRQ